MIFVLFLIGEDKEAAGNTTNYIFFCYFYLLIIIAKAISDQELLFKQHHISATQALAMSDWLLDVDARVIDAIKVAKDRGFISTGDAVIVVTGWVRKSFNFSLFSQYSFFFCLFI